MSWRERVRFDPDRGVAYAPDVILVPRLVAETAVEVLQRNESRPRYREQYRPRNPDVEISLEPISRRWARLSNTGDPRAALDELLEAGIAAQLDHILFSSCCCPPHPGSGIDADPFRANPFRANPFRANPFRANPFRANAGGGCGCGCCGGGWGANPFRANPFRANPFRANADPNPLATPSLHATGRRGSSALPAEEKDAEHRPKGGHGIRVAVLDTGWPDEFEPAVSFLAAFAGLPDHPDSDGDGYLDPASGHGTFVSGLVKGMAPDSAVELIGVLHGDGDGRESDVIIALESLRSRPVDQRPHVVNMSFGAYVADDMSALYDAVWDLREAGVILVAAAGNDATCMPQYPAAFDEVVAVGAITRDEPPEAAFFTNYGPWVNACALGTDLVSRFFEGFDGAEPEVPTDDPPDPDEFHGWAVWSGTSFAAPVVSAAIAHALAGNGTDPGAALDDLIVNAKESVPLLGAVVRVPPAP